MKGKGGGKDGGKGFGSGPKGGGFAGKGFQSFGKGAPSFGKGGFKGSSSGAGYQGQCWKCGGVGHKQTDLNAPCRFSVNEVGGEEVQVEGGVNCGSVEHAVGWDVCQVKTENKYAVLGEDDEG